MEAFNDIARKVDDIERHWLVRETPVFCLRDIKKVLEQSPEMLGRFVCFFDKIARLVVDCCGGRVECKTKVSFDTGNRCAHFVAGSADKFGLLAFFGALTDRMGSRKLESKMIVAINNARPPFNDVRVRRALAHAIDRFDLSTIYGTQASCRTSAP